MKRFNYYLSLMLLLVFTAACNDEFDQPPVVVPVAQHTANISIADFKAKHWQDDRNYIDTVTEDEVIHGWVTSSDETGNIYKCLYIMDESGAGLAISINQNSLFNNYRLGQEIVLPMKGYFVGKYNGQQQLGYPQWYEQGSAWEATFLPQAMWESLVEINGLPDVSKIDTLEVTIDQLKTDPESMLKYQGRLVRISGVSFVEQGSVYAEAPTADGKNGSTNRNIVDENGNTLIVRNSGYADFRADTIPEGDVDVVGLLGCYGTTWQMYLRSEKDVIPGGKDGTKKNPYTVARAIELQNSGSKGWVTGYIVGAVAPEVTTVSSNDDIEWKAPTVLDNTIVIADSPDCKDYTKCVVVPLPQGSSFRSDANLKDHSRLYQKQIKVKGTLASYMGIAGITENTGANNEYELPILPPEEGATTLKETFDNGLPTDWTNLQVSGDKAWYQTEFDSNGYAAMTGFKGTMPPFDSWLITPALDIKNATNKMLTFRTQVAGYNSKTTEFEVYILDLLDPNAASVKVKLNPAIAKASTTQTYSDWVESGEIDLSQWADGCYYIGFRFYATKDDNYATWCVDDVTFGLGEAAPPENRADFETMGDAYGQVSNFTSTKGWVATNCYLFEGGTNDSNPTFKFIGFMTGSETKYAKAPTLNGKTTNVGTIESPVINTGMTKLTFSYGAPYSDKLLSFLVEVYKQGDVIESWTESRSDVVRYQVYTFEKDCQIEGEFTIKITNLCPSNNATTNKDRVAIWNLTWEPL